MNKKQLYESIMRYVAKEVKKVLNESDFHASVEYRNGGSYIGNNDLYDTCGIDIYDPDTRVTKDDALMVMSANFPFNFDDAFRLNKWFAVSGCDVFWNEMVQPENVLASWFIVNDEGTLRYLHYGDVDEDADVLAWGDEYVAYDYLACYLSCNDMDLDDVVCPSGRIYDDCQKIEKIKRIYDARFGK